MSSKSDSSEIKAFESAIATALSQVKRLTNISDARRAFNSAINLQQHVADQLVNCSQKDSTGSNSRNTDAKAPASDGKALLQINFHSPSAGGVNKRKPKLPARLSDASASKSQSASARTHTVIESSTVSQSPTKRGLLSPDSGISPSNSSSPSPNGDLLADSKNPSESTPKRFKEAPSLMNDSLSSVGSAATPDTSGAPHPAINPNLSALAQLTANLSAAISSGAASGGLPSLLPLLSALPAAPLSLQTLIQNLQNGTLSIGNVAAAASPAAATASGAASPRLPVKLESASDSDGSSAPENENSASTSQPLLALSDIKPVTLSSSEPGGAGDSKATSGGERDEAASPPPLAGQSASTEKAIVNQLIRESERVVNGCRVYECRYCGKVYDIAASMRYHMRIIHLRAHLQHARTQCKRCGKHFTSVSAVNRHERICGTLGVAASGSSASGAPTQAPVSPTLPDETAAAAGKSSGPDALNVSPSTNGVASTSNASLSLPTLTPLSSLASSLLSGGLNSDSPFHAMLKQVVQQGLARASEAAASATTTAAAQSSEGTSMNASVSASANAATGDDAAAVNGSVAGSEASDESDEAEADGSENEQELKITDGAGAALASAAH